MFSYTFELKCPLSGTESIQFFSQTDKRESGDVLLQWLIVLCIVTIWKKLKIYHLCKLCTTYTKPYPKPNQ